MDFTLTKHDRIMLNERSEEMCKDLVKNQI